MMTSRPNRTGPSRPHERLVEAYLSDLERALRHLDADERDEVVAAVREHIDTALSEHETEPSMHDVEVVLRELGPVERIAQSGGEASPHPASGDDEGGEHARSGEGWILVGLAALSLVTIAVPFVAVPFALGVGVAAVIGMRGTQGPARRRYQVAVGLSTITVIISLIAALTLFAFMTTDPVPEEPIESSPAAES